VRDVHEDCQDRLRTLDPEAFRTLLRSFVTARWEVPERAIDVSPPSPDHGTDVVVEGRATLVHARRYDRGSISANQLRELATLRDRRTIDTIVVVTTTEFTDDALELAEEADIECIDDDRFCRLLADHGIEVPWSRDRPDLPETVAELSAYWPDELQETAQEVAACVDDLGEFEYDLDRADYSTDLDAVPEGATRPAIKLRFSTAGLFVYVRGNSGWQRVVAVSERAYHRPPDLLERVRTAVEESLDSSA
jgi:hypothetical protein